MRDMAFSETELAEIRARVFGASIPEPNSGCWLWSGSLNAKGYGLLSFYGRCFMAHRASHVAFSGPIPEGLYALHRCDVPCCVNPAHLFLGTLRDNNLDCARKGRKAGRYGRAGSGITGVYYRPNRKAHPWRAMIRVDGQLISLGNFATKQEAVAARAAAERKWFGAPTPRQGSPERVTTWIERGGLVGRAAASDAA